MKLITAIVRPAKFDDVKGVLTAAGVQASSSARSTATASSMATLRSTAVPNAR